MLSTILLCNKIYFFRFKRYTIYMTTMSDTPLKNKVNVLGTLEKGKGPVLPPKKPIPENGGVNLKYDQNAKVASIASVENGMKANKNSLKDFLGTNTVEQVSDSDKDVKNEPEITGSKIDFGSTKIGQKPPQHVTDLIASKGIPFDYKKDYIQHSQNALFLTIFKSDGKKVKMTFDKDLTPDTQDKLNVEGRKETELSNEALKNLKHVDRKIEQIKNQIAKIPSLESLEKIYKKDGSRDQDAEFARDRRLKSNFERLQNELKRLEIIRYVSSRFNTLAQDNRFTNTFNVNTDMNTPDVIKPPVQKIKTPQTSVPEKTAADSWDFLKKYTDGKDGQIVSSVDAQKQEYAELDNKITKGEFSNEQEGDELLEKGIAIEKSLYEQGALNNINTESVQDVQASPEAVSSIVSSVEQYATARESEKNPLETMDQSILKAKNLVQLLKVIEDNKGLRRGSDFFTPAEIKERVIKFLQGNGDIRDIPETAGFRDKVLEIKQDRDQENALLGGENKNVETVKTGDVIDLELTPEQEKRNQEIKKTLQEVPFEPDMDESAVIAQAQYQKYLEQQKSKEQQNANLERLKQNLDAARERYTAEQGKYIGQGYGDRISGHLVKYLGGKHEVFEARDAAKKAYEEAKAEYYQEFAKMNTPINGVMDAMQEEQSKLAETMPKRRRDLAMKAAGIAGTWLVKGAGTVMNTTTEISEKILGKAMNQERAKKLAPWMGRLLMMTVLTGATGGVAALTSSAGWAAGFAGMAAGEGFDFGLKKAGILQNVTQEKVLKNLETDFTNTDLSSKENLANLERGVLNRKKRATLELALRTVLKGAVGFGAATAAGSYLAPTGVEAATEPRMGTIEEEIGTRPEFAPTTGIENGVSPDAFIRPGEGITHAILRQLQANPDLADALNVTGTPTGADAARIAQDFGYIDANGADIRVFDGNNAAYELKLDSAGKVVMNEHANGLLMETKSLGSAFESGATEGYEYVQNQSTVNNVSPENSTAPAYEPMPEYVPRTVEQPIQFEMPQLKPLETGVPISPQSINPFINGEASFDPNNIGANIEHLRQVYPGASTEQLQKMAEGAQRLYVEQGVTTPPNQIFGASQQIAQAPVASVNPEPMPTLAQSPQVNSAGVPRVNPGDMFTQ